MMRPEWMLSRIAILLLAFLTSGSGVRADAAEHAPAETAPSNSTSNGQRVEMEPEARRPLRPPTRSLRRGAAETDAADTKTTADSLHGAMPDLKTVVASLSLVLGLFLTAAWLLKRSLPKSAGLLPGEVVQILGRAQLAGKQFVHLVRCGNKLLLVSVTPGGAETLTEITEPLEVDRLLGICAQQNPTSATVAFREVFQQLGRERSHA